MKRRVKIFLAILAAAFVLSNYMDEYKLVRVTEVIDGDTFKVGYQSVRLIGVNAPEKGEDCYDEATDALKDLIEYKLVRLEKDEKQQDDYGRLLRYVYVDEVFVNKEIARLGMARFDEIPPNTKNSELFLEMEVNAKNARRCIWS